MSTHQTSQVGLRFREEIKAKTHDQHQRLERSMAFLGPEKTLDDYVCLLQTFYGFYHPLERQLRRWQDNPDLRPLDLKRRLLKSDALREDLETLVPHSSGEFSHFSECTHLPSLQTVPEVLGCLYVLEGSTLGGQIITRQLQEAYGITPETGGRFFASYGSEVPWMWQQFLRVLVAYVDANPNASETMVASAQKTFQALEDYLAQQSSCHHAFTATAEPENPSGQSI